MSEQSVILPATQARAAVLQRLAKVLGALPADVAYRVTVEPYKPKRSTSQNALLWRLYTQFIERGGEPLRGYSKDELHEVLLEQFMGFEKYTLFGIEKTRALGRSSDMDKQMFSDFVDHVVTFAAGLGVVLELPNEQEWR